MRRSTRAIASALALGLSLSACGGHSSTIPNAVSNTGSGTQSTARTATVTPDISIPKAYGQLAYTDVGRRPASAPVNVAIVLRYNHEAELEQFIASNSTPGVPHHYLTAAQFNAYYAPTVEQENAVIAQLQAA